MSRLRRVRPTLIALFIIVLSTTDGGFGTYAAQGRTSARTVKITDNDNSGQVTLNVGDTLVVRLRSNPSTGYSWQMAQNDSSLLLSAFRFQKSASHVRAPACHGLRVAFND